VSPERRAHYVNLAEMKELSDGIVFWRSRTPWPADFHNADYARWSRENPHGNFTLDWWGPFLKTLQAWTAFTFPIDDPASEGRPIGVDTKS
jgi:hypothetical protein